MISTFPSHNYEINNYPAVRDYLLSFGIERLEQSGKKYIIDGKEVRARKKTNNKWFETQDSISYWDDFNKQKIVWGNLCLSAQFSFVEEGYFINAPSPMIVSGNKYMLAVLNSIISDWYIRQLGVMRNGGYFEYKPMFVEKLPIPIISNDLQRPFIDIVNQILAEKSQGKDTTDLEANIETMVFALYGLTPYEIDFIQNNQN